MGNKDFQVIKIALTCDTLANNQWSGWDGTHSNNTKAGQAAPQYRDDCASSCQPFCWWMRWVMDASVGRS
jgi:hypothetical protein